MSSHFSARIDLANSWIDSAYSILQKQNSSFIFRSSQVKLSKDVANSFIEGNPFIAEAPTGTGKTLAYLIGALGASESSQLSIKKPIVISTATKSLQQQIFDKDLPQLVKAGLVKKSDVGIAKGKSNYFCLRNANEISSLILQSQSDPDVLLDSTSENIEFSDLEAMLNKFQSHVWDGDFDQYEGVPLKSVRNIAVSNDTCIRKKCAHYNECAYYKKREELSHSKILVANHDLVLRDLLLVAQEKEPTLPVADYTIVFDEAHHLPDKAISIGSAEGSLSGLLNALPKATGIERILAMSPNLKKLIAHKGLIPEDFNRNLLTEHVRELIETLNLLEVDKSTFQHRFAKGEVPKAVLTDMAKVADSLKILSEKLTLLITILRDAQSLVDKTISEKISDLIRRAIDIRVPSEAVSECIVRMNSTKPHAKWFFSREGVISIHASPLEGAQVLRPLLWNSSRVSAVVMVSATLRDIGGFSRFTKRTGAPDSTEYSTLPYSFPYEKSQLIVAPMKATPKLNERKLFITELTLKLPTFIKPREGTLIIFPSWAMLKEFAPKLKMKFGEEKVKVQGEFTVKMLIKKHCEAMDKAEGSILVGVSTLAEGLDLPGNYCSHVIVIALPFAVPSEPVEQELADQLQNRYFSERSLPDAMIKLTQMVGRLLRRESDTGRVTLFDRRLASTSYGRQMLKALPPFEKIISPIVD